MKYHYFAFFIMSLCAFWYLGIQFKELCEKERRMLNEWKEEVRKHKHTRLVSDDDEIA
jgi:hypothetical protein